MPDPNPLSTYYMAAVLEEKPSKAERLGPRTFAEYLPIKGFTSYRIVWEKVREYSPMAGLYAMEDLPDTMDELDFQTYESDVLHWGCRMTLSPRQIMYLRWAGDVNAVNADTGYGVGPAADDYRARDAAKIAKYTRMMNEALDNTFEYLRVGALLGQIWWPPRDVNGNEIAAADVPLSMGRQDLNHLIAFKAATADYGAFHQTATALTGVTGGPTATGVPWNQATSNMIVDMSVIGDLLEESMNMDPANLLVICAKRVVAFQSRNTNFLDWLLGTNRDRVFTTETERRKALEDEFEWKIQYYQSKWEYVNQSQWDQTNPTVHQVPFMSYGTVLILPKPDIYEMGVLATAPAPGPAHNWKDGKYMWMWTNPRPPFDREMGMGGYWWPLVFDNDMRFRLDSWN